MNEFALYLASPTLRGPAVLFQCCTIYCLYMCVCCTQEFTIYTVSGCESWSLFSCNTSLIINRIKRGQVSRPFLPPKLVRERGKEWEAEQSFTQESRCECTLDFYSGILFCVHFFWSMSLNCILLPQYLTPSSVMNSDFVSSYNCFHISIAHPYGV